MRQKRLALLAVTMLLGSLPLMSAGHVQAGADDCVGVALVLSIDASASITDQEYRMQTSGIATALQSPEVLDAIRQAGDIAVAAVVWSSETTPMTHVPWAIIRNEADAREVASAISGTGRPPKGETGLGAGLNAALQAFSSLGTCALRRVINLSGDGEDTRAFRRIRKSPTPSEVRNAAEAAGIEVNGLAILDQEKGLAHYYRTNVITGPGAFVIEVSTVEGVAEAFRKKLTREIGPLQLSEDIVSRPRT